MSDSIESVPTATDGTQENSQTPPVDTPVTPELKIPDVPMVATDEIEQTTMAFWVSESDPLRSGWLKYGELSGKAEGEDRDRFVSYIESCVQLRENEVAEVQLLGTNYSRANFVKKASNVQMASGVAGEDSTEQAINRKLLAYGICSLLRSKLVTTSVEGHSVESRTFPESMPPADFFGGNLAKSTLLAMSGLFRSTSKAKTAVGVTVYEFADALYEQHAKNIHAGLRACTIPQSENYVKGLVKKTIDAVARYRKQAKDRAIQNPLKKRESEELAAIAAQAKIVKQKLGKIESAATELMEQTDVDKATLKQRLVVLGLIPSVTAADAGVIARDPKAALPVIHAIATQGIKADEATVLCESSPNRVELLKSLASTMTAKEVAFIIDRLASVLAVPDAKRLGDRLTQRYSSDPSAGDVALAVKIAIGPILRNVKETQAPLAKSNGKPQPAAA